MARAPEKPLSPSALALAEVVRKEGTIKGVARQLGVVEGTIRHVLNGRWPPKLPVREKMAELWGVPLDGWTSPTATTPAQAPEASLKASEPATRTLVVEMPAAHADAFLSGLQKRGFKARFVDSAPEASPATPDNLTREAVTTLRDVLSRPVGADGRHVGARISAATALLGFVKAGRPKGGTEAPGADSGSFDLEAALAGKE